MATRMELKSLESYRKLFQNEAEKAEEAQFKEKCGELLLELEILNDNFLKPGKGCGGPVEDVFEHLHKVVGRMGEYHFAPVRETESARLYREMDEAIASIAAYRQSCEY